MYNQANVLLRAKRLLNIKDSANDEILTEIITIVEDYSKMFLKIDTLPDNIESFILEVSISRYNKLGAEGYRRENMGDVSVEYSDFVETYAPLLKPFRKLRTL